MAFCITTPRPAVTVRARRHARTALGLASLVGLVAACSAAPAENSAHSSAAITGNLISRNSPDGQITNGNGGCLDLPNGDTTNGNPLHIWACDSSGWNQTWFVDAKGSIHYAANPTKCVDFPAQGLVNGVPTDGTQLQLWDCNGASGPDQVWQFSWTSNIEFASDTAKCIELRNGGSPFVNGSAQNGTAVQVYDCNGTSGQTWALLSGGVQGFQLQNGNGECLDEGSAAASGTEVGLGVCNSTGANQTWCMDGSGALFNCVSQLYVTVPSLSPLTQLALNGALPAPSASTTLSNSNHNLLVGGQACVGVANTPTTSTPVLANGCNGTTLYTWFPRPVGGACPGTVAGDGTCNACAGTVVNGTCQNLPSSVSFAMSGQGPIRQTEGEGYFTDGNGVSVTSGSINVSANGNWSTSGGNIDERYLSAGTASFHTNVSCSIPGLSLSWYCQPGQNLLKDPTCSLTGNSGTSSSLAANWSSVVAAWQSSSTVDCTVSAILE